MTQQTTTNVTWLTQEAHDRLAIELERLSGPGRTEIAKKIEAAREEGDLRENGGYHAAKEEQGKQEARIRQLSDLLASARVGERPADDGVVEPGMVVTVRFAGEQEETRFLLGSREVADDASLDVFSEASPLGSAVMGKRAGDQASYQLPNGRTTTVDVIAATPYAP